uniref:DNA-directed RNA polymerase III subunit RPC3 n=1 Tax=Eucampia antarctica TaxID=49252 RepID=A0A7S2RWL6_9STRA|mmetsp:Transcript_27870/g.26695  ORF Transcript_27870/g.26695 Transcript_27870/m.26695 type:complete len:281 (+) Transcript_27870:174-1016(+)
MSNPFGGFVHRSPLSSVSSHNPMEDVLSNCIRDYFGPTCQTVTDCLSSRGSGTLQQIINRTRHICGREVNEERHRLVHNLVTSAQLKVSLNKARGSEQDGFIEDANPIRAALIVLLHHGIITAHPKEDSKNNNADYLIPTKSKKNEDDVQFIYQLDNQRGRFITRYPRYVEYAKKAVDENAAALVEELLVHGRLRTEDAIQSAIKSIQRTLLSNKDNDKEDDDDDDDNVKDKDKDDDKVIKVDDDDDDKLKVDDDDIVKVDDKEEDKKEEEKKEEKKRRQ